MAETKQLLERAKRAFDPPSGVMDALVDRRNRKLRNQRVRAGVLGLAIAIGVGWLGVVAIRSTPQVPAVDPDSPFLGTWVTTGDADGGTQTMTVRTSADGAVEIEVHDDVAAVCSRTPSTMTGTGRTEGTTSLVIPAPDYTCDDGSEPEAVGGPPVREQLRNFTFVLDAETDILTDTHGGVWVREGAEYPSPLQLPAKQYSEILDGEVTFGAAPRWGQGYAGAWALWFDDNYEERVHVLADPLPVLAGCGRASTVADAEALARSIQSDVDLEATAPVAVTVGGIEALRMDVVGAMGASVCGGFPYRDGAGVVREAEPGGEEGAVVVGRGQRMRLYLLDLPGTSARILAIAIVAPEDRFERVLEAAAPIVDSFEFHTG